MTTTLQKMVSPSESAETDTSSQETSAPIRVEWHPSWCDAVDAALAALPPDHLMDPVLLKTLWDDGQGRDRQKIALLRSGGRTVGVVPLRKRGRFSWQLLSQYVMPYARFHVLPGYVPPALTRLGGLIDCDNVRFHGPRPPSRMLRPETSWVVRLEEDYGALMARTKYGRKDRQCRQHSARLQLLEDRFEDLPDALEQWQSKWAAAGSHATARRRGDLLLGYQTLAAQGRLKTFSLRDGDTLAGMIVNLIGPDTLYFLLTVTRDDYKKDYAGIRNLLASMEWGCAHGLSEYDMLRTSGHYKRFWAEPVVRGCRLVRRHLGSEALGCAVEDVKGLLQTLRNRK